jgi:hypothetical protein
MFELLATACSGIFAGAAVFISLVQHPAARQVGEVRTVELVERELVSRAGSVAPSLATGPDTVSA